jgi:hypothetical protein
VAQRPEQERVAHKKEKRIQRRERREQRNGEFWLREQLGLSSLATSEYSSSDEEEEESDGGRALPREVGAFALLAQSRGGGGGDSAWGGRGSARRQAAFERGNARRRGAGARRWDNWGCSGGHAGGGIYVRRAPEEEETRTFHPEVGDRSSVVASFRSVRA